ncbi:hypothetical protein niasHT_034615 [Heterodera trifolii]|uniref:Nucleoporin NUP35 n=1 Tax=Heterodera trifolii TaxID=157864 RepID=A0ABD2IPM8_9BILA
MFGSTQNVSSPCSTLSQTANYFASASPSSNISPVETVTDSQEVQFAPNFLFGSQPAHIRRSFGTPTNRKVYCYGSPGILKSREGIASGTGKSVHWSPVLVRERSKSPIDEKKFASARHSAQSDKQTPSGLWNGPPLRSLNEDVVGPPEKLFRLDNVSSTDLTMHQNQKPVGIRTSTTISPAEFKNREKFMGSNSVEMLDEREQQQMEEEEDSCYWVTVFGFSPDHLQHILELFSRHGDIMAQKTPKRGNWVHIRYSTPIHAKQALGRNGSIFEGQMIGVVPCQDREALEDDLSLSRGSTPLIPRHSVTPHDTSRQNGSLLDGNYSLHDDSQMVPSTSQYKTNGLPSRARLSISSRAGMRPLNASAISDGPNQSMDLSFQRSAAGENDSFMGKLWTMISNVSTGSNGGS